MSRGVPVVFLLVLVAGLLASGPSQAQVRRFVADLVPEEEMSPVTSSGRGHAEFQVDLSTLKLTWKVTYSGLTSPVTGVHLCAPGQLGTNSLPVLDLAPKGPKVPLEGSATVTAAQVQYMISTWAYINIATQRYRDGEIRGQLDGRAPE